MEREQAQPEAEPAAKPKTEAAPASGVTTQSPGGKDALGKKENLLAPFYNEMVEVAQELAPQFTPLGLHFRPEILLATAMQEAANKDPLTNRSFDNGLGIMQITPYKGQLDASVAKAIGWDNSKDIEYNVKHSRWKEAKPNLQAGAYTMLGKAKSIKNGVKATWTEMDETHRWRAVLYAYNAGEGSAIKALRAGGPNASMISSFKDKSGKTVSHDYTAEIKSKMDYVDGHDPFAAGGGAGGAGATTGGAEPPAKEEPAPAKDQHPDKKPAANGIKASVGRGGVNHEADVRAVQTKLDERGVDPKGIDGKIGAHTISAIEAFQHTFLPHPDGLISNDQITEKHLFGQSGKVNVAPAKPKEPSKAEGAGSTKDAGGKDEDHNKAEPTPAKAGEHPAYAAIAKDFSQTIPGSQMTWHDALYLPSWHRYAKPSDCTNAPMDEILSNIEKQAAALTKVANHFGKAIHVHCWLRPPAYNKQIGGAGNSAHLRGTATDFHMDGISAEAVRKVLKGQPALYPGTGENNVSWVHIDLEHHAWFSP